MDQKLKDAIVKHEIKREIYIYNRSIGAQLSRIIFYSVIWYKYNLVLSIALTILLILLQTIVHGVLKGVKMSKSIDTLVIFKEEYADARTRNSIDATIKILEKEINKNDK